MPDIIDPQERIDRVLSAAEVRMATVFREAIAALKDRLDLDHLADLLERGQIEPALDLLQEAAQQVAQGSTVIFITSGQSTASFLSAAGVAKVSFNIINNRAVQQMQANQLKLITEFREDQRAVVRSVIVDGIERGLNPKEQARNFREVVGLTETQSRAVWNYRKLLQQAGQADLPSAIQAEALTRELRDGRSDRSVLRAIQSGKPLTPAQIDKMVQRYTDNYIKYRSVVIGRTEALSAVNSGNEEMYAQAIEAGKVSAEDLIRTWLTNMDGRERPSHHDLHQVQRGWGQPWQGRDGPIRFPGDPEAVASERIQCRCLLTTRLRRIKG